MTLRTAGPADFGFIRSLAQDPQNAPFITDEDEAALAAHGTTASNRLLIWETGGAARGFALFCGIGEPSGAVELRRLALAKTGTGAGAAFIAALVAHAFDHLGAARLWLDASGENLRAQRVYERAGFTREGVLRQHWYRPSLGRVVDLVLYGLLRDEWQLSQR